MNNTVKQTTPTNDKEDALSDGALSEHHSKQEDNGEEPEERFKVKELLY